MTSAAAMKAMARICELQRKAIQPVGDCAGELLGMKRFARRHELNEIAQAVTSLIELPRDLVDVRPIDWARAAAGGIRQQFAGQRGDKLPASLDQDFLKTFDAVERLSAGQLASRVNLRA